MIKISVNCPECGEEIEKKVFIIDNSSLNISAYEQQDWKCEICEKEFFSGDFELLTEDEI